MLNNQTFKTELKKWLNHKIILANNSTAYKVGGKYQAVFLLKNKFSSFLTFTNNYSIGQLALDVKRNQHLLETALPIPNNPSYQNANIILHQILDKATQIIKEYNLQNIL